MSTFNSWSAINENLFRNRGRQVIVDPETGKRQIAVYKVQKNNRFMIKLIKMRSIIDEAGNLTKAGSESLISFINAQMALVQALGGKLDDTWFATKCLAYTVKKDTQYNEEGGKKGREKVQFAIINKSDYPNLDLNNVQFINSVGLEKDETVQDIENLVIIDDTNEDPIDEEEHNNDNQTEDDIIDDQSDSAGYVGKKFTYYMRTNRINYIMEFTADAAIEALPDGEGPSGVVTWEDPKVMWNTDLDNPDSSGNKSQDWIKNWKDVKLSTDGEITNAVDRSFLMKMLTDAAFRDKTLKDYEDEAAKFGPESLRSMLYYKDNTRIFPGASAPEKNDDTAQNDSSGGSSNNANQEYQGFII